MSIALMVAVLDSALKPSERLVAMPIANAIHDARPDDGCWLGIATIARQSGLDERTVQRTMRTLADRGVLIIEERRGRSSVYRLDPRRLATPGTVSPPALCHPTPGIAPPPPPALCHPTPGIAPPESQRNDRGTEKGTKNGATVPPVAADPSLTLVAPDPMQSAKLAAKAKNVMKTERRAIAIDILAYLNERAGRDYRAVDKTLEPILARLADGATRQDAFAVIDAKVAEWAGTEKTAAWLRPSTLFRPGNFNEYLGALPKRPGSAVVASHDEAVTAAVWLRRQCRNGVLPADHAIRKVVAFHKLAPDVALVALQGVVDGAWTEGNGMELARHGAEGWTNVLRHLIERGDLFAMIDGEVKWRTEGRRLLDVASASGWRSIDDFTRERCPPPAPPANAASLKVAL